MWVRRFTVLVILAGVSLARADAARADGARADGAAPPGAACALAEDPFAPAALLADIQALADPALDGRAPGSNGDLAARGHVAARLGCLGLLPGADAGGYEQAFSLTIGATGATANLVALLPAEDPAAEHVLVMAHHDHLGAGHLGANDNASGVAALLAVAQALAASGPHHRTIAFVAFGAEEQGLLGSAHYLAAPPAALPLARLRHVINLDMIGSHSSRRRVHVFGARAGQAGTAHLQKLVRAYPRTRFVIGGESVRGDHHGFAELGIPYAFFWTPDARCYHRRCDTASRIDAKGLSDIAKVAAALVAHLAAK